MTDIELYTSILDIKKPWFIEQVFMDPETDSINIVVKWDHKIKPDCPECLKQCSIHDTRKRVWQHLNTCHLITIIHADVPRSKCDSHGVKQILVPWADNNRQFTGIYEAHKILMLQETTISATARLSKLSWDQIAGIMGRAVCRGLQRRTTTPVKHLSIDEISFQRKHDYVTIVCDREQGVVLDVLNDRKSETLENWLLKMPEKQRNLIETITMDMWDPFIAAFKKVIHNAVQKICFDRFHVAAHFSKAVNKVRAEEHKQFLSTKGESPLTKTKHDWQRNAGRYDNRSRKAFMKLTRMALKTARAWALKETASLLWEYLYIGKAKKMWGQLLRRIKRSRLKPMITVGKMVNKYLWGILNAIRYKATNASAESMNAKVQKVKYMACGFRNRQRFRDAILFYFGGLDLMPSGVKI